MGPDFIPPDGDKRYVLYDGHNVIHLETDERVEAMALGVCFGLNVYDRRPEYINRYISYK